MASGVCRDTLSQCRDIKNSFVLSLFYFLCCDIRSPMLRHSVQYRSKMPSNGPLYTHQVHQLSLRPHRPLRFGSAQECLDIGNRPGVYSDCIEIKIRQKLKSCGGRVVRHDYVSNEPSRAHVTQTR
ncbi:hypothetical protein J1N35_018433 [Gossypium stocksii]|uniref:Uncharacterized protein n=1 Tax=Gossypium stocksii TaxID=47602 RepID=A0A9D3VP03_9ROSI|nr:hypothetical protein J1N35_018433 [Gossypium stocksii]